jgi:Rogdi leucine zipper containing protein
MFRTLHPVNPATPTSFTADAFSFTADTFSGLSIRQRLGLATRLPEHEESNETFTFRGQEVQVREKVRVESQDPSLITIMAKLSALDHSIGIARRNLAIVMGVEDEE